MLTMKGNFCNFSKINWIHKINFNSLQFSNFHPLNQQRSNMHLEWHISNVRRRDGRVELVHWKGKPINSSRIKFIQIIQHKFVTQLSFTYTGICHLHSEQITNRFQRCVAKYRERAINDMKLILTFWETIKNYLWREIRILIYHGGF